MGRVAWWRRTLVRWVLRVRFAAGGTPDEIDGIPRVRGVDLAPALPFLREGDIVLTGNNGQVSHAAVHVGDGRIVHSMATEKTMRGWRGSFLDALRRPFRREPFTGVIEETWPAFFERFERDTWVILRQPGLGADARRRGLDRVRGLVGQPYDYTFDPGDDRYYCTELVIEYLQAALGGETPDLATTRHKIPLLLERDVYEPVALLGLDGFVVVAANPAARASYPALIEEGQVVA